MSINTIIRSPKDKDNPYTMIRKECLDDKRLSWGARGLLAHLLSKPDNWSINRDNLTHQAPNGENSVKSILKELRDYGYLVRNKYRDQDGTFQYWSELHEVPLMDKPLVDKPLVDNQPLLNNNILITDKLNKAPIENFDNRPSKRASSSKKEIKGTRIDPNMTLDDHLCEIACKEGLHESWIQSEFESFMDYYSNSALKASQALHIDWNKTWRNWCKNAIAYDRYDKKTKPRIGQQETRALPPPSIPSPSSSVLDESLQEFLKENPSVRQFSQASGFKDARLFREADRIVIAHPYQFMLPKIDFFKPELEAYFKKPIELRKLSHDL